MVNYLVSTLVVDTGGGGGGGGGWGGVLRTLFIIQNVDYFSKLSLYCYFA